MMQCDSCSCHILGERTRSSEDVNELCKQTHTTALIIKFMMLLHCCTYFLIHLSVFVVLSASLVRFIFILKCFLYLYTAIKLMKVKIIIKGNISVSI